MERSYTTFTDLVAIYWEQYGIVLRLTLSIERPKKFYLRMSFAKTTQLGRKKFLRKPHRDWMLRQWCQITTLHPKNTIDTCVTWKRKRNRRRTNRFSGLSNQNAKKLHENFTNLTRVCPLHMRTNTNINTAILFFKLIFSLIDRKLFPV